MARKSKGRGTAAAFGLLLLFAGLVGGGVLFASSVRRPTQTIEGFARAPVGCTTTLEFSETGVFFVFEDIGPATAVLEGDCEAVANPSQTFAFELSGPDGPMVPRADKSLSYDTDDYLGFSVARFEIDVPGEYEIVVVGDDPSVVAAIGRDPDDGIDDLRQRAIVVASVGVVLGGLLLLLAGRRSRKAAAFLTPDGPGWSIRYTPKDQVVTPDGSPVAQSPVNPHEPDEQVSIAGPLSEVNRLLADAPRPKQSSPWAPPAAGQAVPEQAAGPVEPAGEVAQAAVEVSEPAGEVAQAAVEVSEPAGEVAQAAVEVSEPAGEVAQAAVEVSEPAGEVAQAAVEVSEPAGEVAQAAVEVSEPAGEVAQAAVEVSEPAGEVAQAAVEVSEPAGEVAQAAVEVSEPAGEVAQAAVDESEPAGEVAQAAVDESEPAGEVAQAAVDESEPAGEVAQAPVEER